MILGSREKGPHSFLDCSLIEISAPCVVGIDAGMRSTVVDPKPTQVDLTEAVCRGPEPLAQSVMHRGHKSLDRYASH